MSENGKSSIIERLKKSKHKWLYCIWILVAGLYAILSLLTFTNTLLAYVVQLTVLIETECDDTEKASLIRDEIFEGTGKKYCRFFIFGKKFDNFNPYSVLSKIDIFGIGMLIIVVLVSYSGTQVPVLVNYIVLGIGFLINMIHKSIPIVYKILNSPIYKIVDKEE